MSKLNFYITMFLTTVITTSLWIFFVDLKNIYLVLAAFWSNWIILTFGFNKLYKLIKLD